MSRDGWLPPGVEHADVDRAVNRGLGRARRVSPAPPPERIVAFCADCGHNCEHERWGHIHMVCVNAARVEGHRRVPVEVPQ